MTGNPIEIYASRRHRAVFGDKRLEKRGSLYTTASMQLGVSVFEPLLKTGPNKRPTIAG